MKIFFVTTNKHKYEEVKEILSPYGLEVEQLDRSYPEDHDASLEIIAKTAAKNLAEELGQSIILDDTGVFFEAYDGFPGALPKFAFNTLGYKGFFKLLEGENRKAYFKCVAAFCQPGEEPILFEGKMVGTISETVINEEKDLMPYERIFVPDGYTVTTSDLTREEKNKISHRFLAFKKLGEYLNEIHKA